MRVLFATQSNTLRMFDALRVALDRVVGLERCGFILADAWAYQNWLKESPDFELQGHLLLKEWEITSQKADIPDLELLQRYEQELGTDDLFGAIVADRRLIMGPDCTYSQDYRRRFRDEELLSILQAAVIAVDRLFEELRPNVILGFVCVTIFDYLVYLFAKSRNICFLNLRPTRIADRVTYGSTLIDPSPELVSAYTDCLDNGSDLLNDARTHIERVRKVHSRYEGVVRPSSRPARKIALRRNPFTASIQLLKMHREYRSSEAAKDNHCPGILRPIVFAAFISPVKAKLVQTKLGRLYVRPHDLTNRRYAFYPLHAEPEVSLLVYGRPFLNQIEVIRYFAHSLPSDMILVVKEHPWMVGKRSLASYRKILNIPRVYLGRPEVEAREFVQKADLVTVLTSSVGLEGVMLKRPVLTLAHCPFNIMPDTMVNRCVDLTRLPQAVRELLECHSHDERCLEAYVAAVLEVSVGIGLYSVLLGRTGVHIERQSEFDSEIQTLAEYTLRRLKALEGDV